MEPNFRLDHLRLHCRGDRNSLAIPGMAGQTLGGVMGCQILHELGLRVDPSPGHGMSRCTQGPGEGLTEHAARPQ